MTGRARGLRVPAEIEREIEREAEERGKSWSAVTVELLDEAVRMRRAPGILFVEGPVGRRAVIAGTGLDVWEVVATWRAGGEDDEELRANYPWLTDAQIRAAMGYYALYPEEIDARLEYERRWTPERARRELPFAAPRRPRK